MQAEIPSPAFAMLTRPLPGQGEVLEEALITLAMLGGGEAGRQVNLSMFSTGAFAKFCFGFFTSKTPFRMTTWLMAIL